LTVYEQGCIRNWLEFAKKSSCVGWVPIWVNRTGNTMPADVYAQNMHKPCLVQHAAFIVRENGGDIEWLREGLMNFQYFVNNYRNHHRHACGSTSGRTTPPSASTTTPAPSAGPREAAAPFT